MTRTYTVPPSRKTSTRSILPPMRMRGTRTEGGIEVRIGIRMRPTRRRQGNRIRRAVAPGADPAGSPAATDHLPAAHAYPTPDPRP